MVVKRGLASLIAAVVATVIVPLHATPSQAAAPIRFRNITRESGGPPGPIRTWGALWSDYDLDGDPDLFVNRHWNAPSLFRNFSGYYHRQEENFVYLRGYEGRTPGMVDRHSCAWGEANGDGRPDLYCTVGAHSGTSWGPNQLAIPTSPTRFIDYGRSYGVEDRYGRGRSVNWLDFDGDGDLDIFVANDKREGTTNVMFRNTGEGFERAAVGLEESIKSLTSSWADWDADGDPDLLVTRGDVSGSGSQSAIAYLNVSGLFVRTSLDGITTDAWKAAAWGDFNGDGLPDLLVVKSDRTAVFRNLGASFQQVASLRVRKGRSGGWIDVDNDGDLDLYVVQGGTGTQSDQGPNLADFFLRQNSSGWKRVDHSSFRGRRRGNGDSVAVADHDRDGRQDLFVTNGHNPSGWKGRSTLLRNTTRAGRWTGLALHGGRRNPQGIGVRVFVTAGSLSYQRQLTDAVNYRGQSELGYIHLGLRRAPQASVRVEWLNGAIDCVTARAGRIKQVRQGRSPCP